MDPIDTILDVPADALTHPLSDRDNLFRLESAWRGRPNPASRPHRVKRKRQPTKQLTPRGFARLRSVPGDVVSDDALLAGLRDGDVGAGDTLIARYAAPLLRYLQRLAGPDLAEELHQQTWLSVLDHVGRFRSDAGSSLSSNGGGFKAWLFRIATNKANDVWRSRGRERNAKEGLKRILDPRAPHAAARAEASEQNGELASALEKLPREQREALVLRFYSNMKFSEIAQVVGCPVNTALTRVHKGILKLRQIMEAE